MHKDLRETFTIARAAVLLVVALACAAVLAFAARGLVDKGFEEKAYASANTLDYSDYVMEPVYADQSAFVARKPLGYFITGLTSEGLAKASRIDFEGSYNFPWAGVGGDVTGITSDFFSSMPDETRKKVLQVRINNPVSDLTKRVVSHTAMINGKQTTWKGVEETNYNTEKGFMEGLTNVSSVAIPDTLTNIPPKMCKDLPNAFGINVPITVQNIGYQSFMNAGSMRLNLNGTHVKTIGDSAFAKSFIAAVNIPSSVTSIGAYAFAQCDMEILTFEGVDGPLRIGVGAFQFNSLAKGYAQPDSELTVPNNVTIAPDAFYNQSTYAVMGDPFASDGSSRFSHDLIRLATRGGNQPNPSVFSAPNTALPGPCYSYITGKKDGAFNNQFGGHEFIAPYVGMSKVTVLYKDDVTGDELKRETFSLPARQMAKIKLAQSYTHAPVYGDNVNFSDWTLNITPRHEKEQRDSHAKGRFYGLSPEGRAHWHKCLG